MNRLIAPLWELLTLGAVVGARPSAAGDGVDIAAWRKSAYTPELAVVLLDGTLAAGLTAPGGGADGVELWGYVNSLWKFMGSLKSGGQINIIGATQGYAEEVQHVGIATRLAIAATVSAGVVTATFAPLELWGGR
jgi:hypothetical protein